MVVQVSPQGFRIFLYHDDIAGCFSLAASFNGSGDFPESDYISGLANVPWTTRGRTSFSLGPQRQRLGDAHLVSLDATVSTCCG